MRRRDFLRVSSATVGALASLELEAGPAGQNKPIDAAWYRQSRRYAKLPGSEIAYVECGRRPAAVFLHGYPLNGFQWRGSLERLQGYRRCIALDVLGMGYTRASAGQAISPAAQASMLAMFLDALGIYSVDLVANDSGGMVAQMFLAEHPRRVRTLLLTNCYVDTDSPPVQFVPFIEAAQKGLFVDDFILPQLKDKALPRSPKGMGGLAYTYPEGLTDETIETYFRPLVETPLKKAQVNRYAASMGTNSLVGIREALRRWEGPARMVWGLKDALFGVEWAEWLDRTLPGSRGVRRVPGANLFFPEEMPDLIAEEAAQLWLEQSPRVGGIPA